MKPYIYTNPIINDYRFNHATKIKIVKIYFKHCILYFIYFHLLYFSFHLLIIHI